jgi:hypothetical protein
MDLDYYLIDAIAPFFTVSSDTPEVNWSKVPFSRLENGDGIDPQKAVVVKQAFHRYIDVVTAEGYNAISLDDMAHLVQHSFYPDQLNRKIDSYRAFYRQLVDYARAKGCRIFITTDILFLNRFISEHTGMEQKRNIRFLGRSVRRLFSDFPDLAGIIVRIGESDGLDVQGDFQSRLVIKTARQCRHYLKKIVQVCEQFDKQLIMRTWTLGAFPIGDLMWNPHTFHAVFDNLPSQNLILSQKFGETDFFRYQTMSPLLFEGSHRRIVEFQARREYEGFGEFPSYTGFDYERYARYLRNCPMLCGISVWCQTGGWSHFKRLSFCADSSLWVELNVSSTLQIFRDTTSAEKAATNFISRRYPGTDGDSFVRFLRLADKAVKELWYIPEFAVQRLYFRRTRVPPLFYLFWDTIMINHTVRKIIRRFVHERREAIEDGYRALHAVEKMRRLAEMLPIDTDEITFQYRTFEILAVAREYYFGDWSTDLQKRITQLVTAYRNDYPQGFHLIADFNPVKFKKWLIKSVFHLSLRRHPHYRLIDRLVLLRFASLIYPLFRVWEKRRLPSFTRNQAMGIEVLFK